MTLLEVPTVTLLFYYKDIKQEIVPVHTLLLEEYGVSKKWVIIVDKRQDKTTASTQAETRGCQLRIITVPGAQEEARRNGVETETNKDKSSSCNVFMLRVMTYVVFSSLSTVLELNWCCAICISRGLI